MPIKKGNIISKVALRLVRPTRTSSNIVEKRDEERIERVRIQGVVDMFFMIGSWILQSWQTETALFSLFIYLSSNFIVVNIFCMVLLKANLVEKLLEHDLAERFCKDISQLLVSPNRLHFGFAIVIPDDLVSMCLLESWCTGFFYQWSSGLVIVHP